MTTHSGGITIPSHQAHHVPPSPIAEAAANTLIYGKHNLNLFETGQPGQGQASV